MSSSLDAALVYGYDLGDEDGWKFNQKEDRELDDFYPTAWPSWMELDGDDEEEPDDPISQFQDRLDEVVAGFTEEFPFTGNSDRIRDWVKRRDAARSAAGLDVVHFESYGVHDYTGWVFGVRLLDGDGALTEVSMTGLASSLASEVNYRKYQALLKRCLDALEITLEGDPSPRLLLAASYG